MKKFLLALIASTSLFGSAWAVDRDDMIMALQDYMEMAAFGDGVIMPEQFAQIRNDAFIIDARQASDYAEHHIPGAVHIDWRFIMSELDQIPEDRLIVVYCDTGILSSKAHMALRLVGYDQARVLFNGLNGWHAHIGQ